MTSAPGGACNCPAHPRIDVHHHIAPPAYLAEVDKIQPSRGPVGSWSVAKSIEDQEQGGVTTSMLTVTTPGFWFGDREQTRRIVRSSNEYAAGLVRDHPGRFGMFVSMPLPDIDASLREIEYGMDVLGADGIALFTNYRDRWLGNPDFEPVMAELDRRRAVVHVHPDVPDCTRNMGDPFFRSATIEYCTDTTRAIAHLLFSGTIHRHPNIRFIWSHAGGTMPFMVERLTNAAAVNPEIGARVPNGVMNEVKRFYYDTAQAAHVFAMSSLRHLVEPSQIVFGTDFPFVSSAETVGRLRNCGMFDETELRLVDYENSHRLMPRLRSLAEAGAGSS